MSRFFIDDDTTNPTSVFEQWLDEPWRGLALRATAPIEILTTDPFTTVGYEPIRIDGGGSELWFPRADSLSILQHNPGPAGYDSVRIDDLRIGGAGLFLQQANRWKIDVTVKHAPVGLIIHNEIERGQSEQNEIRARIVNCDEGIRISKTTQAWGSFKGTKLQAIISGAERPVKTAPNTSIYGSRWAIEVWDGDTTAQSFQDATFCIKSSIHMADLDLFVEGITPVALYLEDAKGANWPADAHPSSQGHVRLQTVHAATLLGVFSGSKAHLPNFDFQLGNPNNGNSTRPSWSCSDGEVWTRARHVG